MTNDCSPVNPGIAPLRNVALLGGLVRRIIDRAPGLPGLGVFYGPSGYGKTVAAMYSANKHRAYHIQVKSVWTRKKLCTSVLQEMGIVPAKTIPDMMDQIGMELSLSRRPLIIDEADYLVTKQMIEVIRDIYESSHGTIILIGEELLPAKLEQWERFHGRVAGWCPAEPGSVTDAEHLARIYCPGIAVADDLLAAIHKVSGGSVRRICVNLDLVREAFAGALPPGGSGITASLAGWEQLGGKLFTGKAPARRIA